MSISLEQMIGQLQSWQTALKAGGIAGHPAAKAFDEALQAVSAAAQAASEVAAASVQGDTQASTAAPVAANIAGSDFLLPQGAEPRLEQRPSIREFMDATGADFETASDVIYGVVGSNQDHRDWQAIMAASDPLAAARAATGAMYARAEGVADITATLEQRARAGNLAILEEIGAAQGTARTTVYLVDQQGNLLTGSDNAAYLARRAINFGFDFSNDLVKLNDSVAAQARSSPASHGGMARQLETMLGDLANQQALAVARAGQVNRTPLA